MVLADCRHLSAGLRQISAALEMGDRYSLGHLCQPALSNIEHYASHWPLFRSPTANALWRMSGIFVFATPLEYRYPHVEHHRLNNSQHDPITTLASPEMHTTIWSFVVKGALLYPWNSLP